MRVLHLHSGNMYGGVETLLATLVREAGAVPGMSSDVALCFPGRLEAELEAASRPPFMLPPMRLSRLHTLLRTRHALRRLLREQPFDAVVCHQSWACVAFGPVVRAAGFPVVLWVHMPVESGALLDRLARRVRPDLAICNSQFTQSRVREWLPGIETEVVYYPVQPIPAVTIDRHAVRQALQTPPDDVVVVMASRMEAWKGHRVLLAALERMCAVPGWTCWIVGGAQSPDEAAYERELRSAARVFGLEARIRFTGQRADVRSLLAAADLYCQPNTAPEAFGIVFVEALYAGLPVITSGIGGPLEILDRECGSFVPPGDAHALQEVLRALVRDGDARQRMGQAARRRPASFCDLATDMRRLQRVLATSRPAKSAALEAHAG